MSLSPFARAGFEQAGEMLGDGAPFHVVRAISVGGQVVRVVFSAEPKAKSPAASDDCFNGANYQVAVVTGQGQVPQSVGTLLQVIAFPAFGVYNAGEYAGDLQVDRPLIVGMSYSVTVSHAVVGADATPIGSPYSWVFVGAARPVVTLAQRGKMGLVDFDSDPILGGINIDNSGDWAADKGDTVGTRKRCLRRATVFLNSFAHLQGYGLNYDIKCPATTNKLAAMRTDLQKQLKQEPDVTGVTTQIGTDARGFISIGMTVQTPTGQVTSTVKSTPNGITVQ